MLDYRSDPHSRIVEIVVDGTVSRDEFNRVITEIDSKIEDFGSVDLLEEIRDIGRMPALMTRE